MAVLALAVLAVTSFETVALTPEEVETELAMLLERDERPELMLDWDELEIDRRFRLLDVVTTKEI